MMKKRPALKKSIRSFDHRITTYLLSLPDWVRPLMLFMTLLGQPPITIGVSAGVIGFGIARNNNEYVYIGAIAIATVAVCSFLKLFLRRARPDNEYVRGMLFQTFSFPSGHATGSLVCFGSTAYILLFHFPHLTVALLSFITVISVLIGASRVYLGAHYPSDIIGGWLVGAAGLLLIVMLYPVA